MSKREIPRIFQIDITVEHGQLFESLHSEDDRLLMIQRMDAILSDTDPGKKELRDGLIQVLVDQLTNNNGHEPIIIRTGAAPGEAEEQILWHCDHAEIEVEMDKFRQTDRTPRKPGHDDDPFKFSDGKKGLNVHSRDYKNKRHSEEQKFYKFSIEGEDRQGNKLTLDPCVICER